MNRRSFALGLGSSILSWPAWGQKPAVLPIVGFLNGQRSATWARQLAAFRDGFQAAGFIEGQNVIIEYRFAEGHPDRLDSLAQELVLRNASVIVTSGGTRATTRAALKATTIIPIIVAFGDDPVEGEFVTSINRPGGSVTGVSLFNGTLLAKQIEILHSTLPNQTSIAVLINNSMPTAPKYSAIAHVTAKSLGVALSIFGASSDNDIREVFASLESRSIGGLAVIGDSRFTDRRSLIINLASKHRIPTIYGQRIFVEAGGLMSYGSNRTAVYRSLGAYAGRVLNGANVADLPILQPSSFELILNQRSAEALGISFPNSLLTLADEIFD